MATIQIRNIPDDDYAALRDAADAQGKSLQSYMLEQAHTMARRVKKQAALDAVATAWERSARPGMTLAEINDAIREVRGD